MSNESHAHEPHRSKNLPFNENEAIQGSQDKICYLCVDRLSEREISRHLAAVCNLLLLALARDFGVNSPGTVTIVPSETTRGVELRITGRD